MKKFTQIWKELTAEKFDEYTNTLGIAHKAVDTNYAGPEPKSLLAEQDLETTTKSEGTFAVWFYDKRGNRKCSVFNNQIDADAFMIDLLSVGYSRNDIELMIKGQVEQTGDKLKEAASDAEDADTKTEIKSVVDNIKAIQLKRQSATINERQKTMNIKKHLLGPSEARQIVLNGMRQGRSEMELINRLMEGGYKNSDAIRILEDCGFYDKKTKKSFKDMWNSLKK